MWSPRYPRTPIRCRPAALIGLECGRRGPCGPCRNRTGGAMAVCSGCGGELNSQERFCGNCGLDSQAAAKQTAVQPVVVQQTVPQQVVYTPPAAQAAPAASAQRCSCTARAAMGLGIGGGLMGILWGALGPYLTIKLPSNIAWTNYGTGLRAEILLVIGLVLGALRSSARPLRPRPWVWRACCLWCAA
jgi:hypothetical protein